MDSLVLVDGVYYTGWMTTVDAARMLGVSSSWVRMLAGRGRLKYRKPEGVGRGATGWVLMHEIALLRQAPKSAHRSPFAAEFIARQQPNPERLARKKLLCAADGIARV